MTQVNKKCNFVQLDLGSKNNIIDWASSRKPSIVEKNQEYDSKIKHLLSKKYRRQTILMWLNWFTYTFIYYGISLYLPDIYKILTNVNNSNNFN